ncbi:MAG: hypothetical protein K8H74_19485 [Notoacmeibacter sp.]|nr:hypothetical protein [Notoacmeibacter sp.]
MKRGTKILAAIVGAAFVGWLGWRLAYPSYSWHQKLTVAVETPEGVKAGSAVIALAVKAIPQVLPDAANRSNTMRGEATVVDLGGGRILFVLLPAQQFLAHRVFRDRYEMVKGDETLPAARAFSRLSESREVPSVFYPLMVTFGDIADPKTVRRVDPDDMDASFGPGYRLASVTLEITDEPMTEGKVDEVLGWLSKYPEPSVLPKVSPTDFSFEAKLRHGEFIRR